MHTKGPSQWSTDKHPLPPLHLQVKSQAPSKSIALSSANCTMRLDDHTPRGGDAYSRQGAQVHTAYHGKCALLKPTALCKSPEDLGAVTAKTNIIYLGCVWNIIAYTS